MTPQSHTASPATPPSTEVQVAQDLPQARTDAPRVTITSRAAKVMAQQLAKRGTPEGAIRFGIRGGGCTGYSYHFAFEDRPARASDHLIVVDGTRVLIDAKSMLLLNGTVVDFETGMRGHGFRFDNPNVKSNCGCGESVTF